MKLYVLKYKGPVHCFEYQFQKHKSLLDWLDYLPSPTNMHKNPSIHLLEFNMETLRLLFLCDELTFHTLKVLPIYSFHFFSHFQCFFGWKVLWEQFSSHSACCWCRCVYCKSFYSLVLWQYLTVRGTQIFARNNYFDPDSTANTESSVIKQILFSCKTNI